MLPVTCNTGPQVFCVQMLKMVSLRVDCKCCTLCLIMRQPVLASLLQQKQSSSSSSSSSVMRCHCSMVAEDLRQYS